MTALLGAWGMEVVEAAGGEEALADAGRRQPLDVAVLDMLMPGSRRSRLAASLHERIPAFPS